MEFKFSKELFWLEIIFYKELFLMEFKFCKQLYWLEINFYKELFLMEFKFSKELFWLVFLTRKILFFVKILSFFDWINFYKFDFNKIIIIRKSHIRIFHI